MCGRFNNHLPRMLGWAEMLTEWPQVRLSYNVAPSSQIAAFQFDRENSSIEDLDEVKALSGNAMRWGMIARWSKTFDSKYATFNARLESVAEKATYRSAWKNAQRCLIPMAGYYEWQVTKDGSAKQPFYISDMNVGGLVAAGLYEDWGPADQQQQSCTMITRPADTGLDSIHHRMPVLLDPDSARDWLRCEVKQATQFLADTNSPDVVYWPVAKAVGNVRNDDQRLCQEVEIE